MKLTATEYRSSSLTQGCPIPPTKWNLPFSCRHHCAMLTVLSFSNTPQLPLQPLLSSLCLGTSSHDLDCPDRLPDRVSWLSSAPFKAIFNRCQCSNFQVETLTLDGPYSTWLKYRGELPPQFLQMWPEELILWQSRGLLILGNLRFIHFFACTNGTRVIQGSNSLHLGSQSWNSPA